MASSFQKLTAEQVRARYRQQLFAEDLIDPKVVDALDDTGLIHSSKLGAALNVEIPLWDDRATLPGKVNVLFMEWLPSSSTEWLEVSPPEDIPGKNVLPDSSFPLPRKIPLEIFKDYNGRFLFRYRVKNWNTASYRTSDPVPVIIDRSAPEWVEPLKAMIHIVEKPITDVVLDRDGGAFAIIPEYVEPNGTAVTVKVALLDRAPLPTEDITDFVVLTVTVPPDRKVLIPAGDIRRLGPKNQFAVCWLLDAAGNRGERSLAATLWVALGSLPSDLDFCSVPLAQDAGRVIDRADAAFPTRVHIEDYTGSHYDHGIRIRWGGQILPRTSVGAHGGLPLSITVPWDRMALEYDFNSSTHVQPVEVDYEILVGDVPYASPGHIDINQDFAIPKPGDPDPKPIDPSLNSIEFESFSGSSTELTMADIDEPATASIKLFDNPKNGDTFTLYYNGAVVTSPENPYVADGTEGLNKVVDMSIPWDVIKLTPVMDDLPMYYKLTNANFTNPQESLRTTINVLVETVEHPLPVYPDPSGDDLISCNSLEVKDGEWGVIMHIPPSTYLKKNTDVEVEWRTYDDTDTEIPLTDHDDTVTVSEDEERNGIYWLVPYEKCLKPTYPGPHGVGKMKYFITVRGVRVPSPQLEVYIAVFEGDGSGNIHCRFPRP